MKRTIDNTILLTIIIFLLFAISATNEKMPENENQFLCVIVLVMMLISSHKLIGNFFVFGNPFKTYDVKYELDSFVFYDNCTCVVKDYDYSLFNQCVMYYLKISTTGKYQWVKEDEITE